MAAAGIISYYDKREMIELMSEHRWVTFYDFRTSVLALRRLRFNVHSDREEARELISNLGENGIVSTYSRFPDDGYYVDIDGKRTTKYITRLLQLLDQPNRAIERCMNNANSSNTAVPIYNALGDANVAYDKVLMTLTSMVSTLRPLSLYHQIDIFNRDSFEHCYKLLWVTRDKATNREE